LIEKLYSQSGFTCLRKDRGFPSKNDCLAVRSRYFVNGNSRFQLVQIINLLKRHRHYSCPCVLIACAIFGALFDANLSGKCRTDFRFLIISTSPLLCT